MSWWRRVRSEDMDKAFGAINAVIELCKRFAVRLDALEERMAKYGQR